MRPSSRNKNRDKSKRKARKEKKDLIKFIQKSVEEVLAKYIGERQTGTKYRIKNEVDNLLLSMRHKSIIPRELEVTGIGLCEETGDYNIRIGPA